MSRPPIGPRANPGPQISPTLRFQIEKVDAAMRQGYRIEASQLGPFFSMRFFNDIESVMMLGTADQLKQIVREIEGALELGRDRKRRKRQRNSV